MLGRRIKDYLDANDIRYIYIMHSPAYTAQGIAHTAHISGKEIAKSVILKIDGTFFMAVVPANNKVNIYLLKDIYSAESVELASEDEFKDKFPDCEIGAMPPFGNLYDMDVIVCRELTEDKEIAFNAGTHTELIKMDYRDFQHLVKPRIVDFAS
ncbi:MAG: YbaK/EbsC family protein [bacterium]|nr:YbaK/EbsC family protein [bacterium]